MNRQNMTWQTNDTKTYACCIHVCVHCRRAVEDPWRLNLHDEAVCCTHFCLSLRSKQELCIHFLYFLGHIVWTTKETFSWGVDLNSLKESDQRFAHHGWHCQSKPKKSRPRHLHQSTLNLGDAAPCYITTHKQVTVNNWCWINSHRSTVVSFLLFMFVRVILGSQPMDVLSSSTWETPASPPSIRPGWISATTPHRCSVCCSHTLKRCTGQNTSLR